MCPVSKYLAGLNPRQREAVEQTEGPVLVLAGAGSGKTRVITHRIAYILGKRLAEPQEVLAVTFTNKAANEMRERVAGIVGSKRAGKVVISTFHSFCLKVLRKHIEHIGYRKNFTISSESDARMLLRRVVDDLPSAEGFDIGTFKASISLHKNRTDPTAPVRPGPVEKESREKYEENLGRVIDAYQSALRAANSVDFDDLLLLSLQLFREHPRILGHFQSFFRYVMVDEYQDTNGVQLELLRALVEKHRNLCVVGDDDQSIYAFRGADSRSILGFEQQFSGARVITLDQNYRSTSTILEAANGVIGNNVMRHPKKLWSELGKGAPIDWIVTADEEEEAKHAVRWLKYIQEKTGACYRDFALLYRSNQQSRPLEVTFRQAGIPYIVVGGQDFFERAEVKDIVSYLKVLANPRDEAAFLRVVNMPRRGIGDATLHAVHDLCRKEKLSFGKALAETLNRGLAPPGAAKGIRAYLSLLTRFRKRFREPGISLCDAAAELVGAIDYHGELQRMARNPEHAHNRWLNVEAVFDAIKAYEADADNPTLGGFLDESHLNGDGEAFSREDRKKSGVTLMTIHSAKGLEFPYVFIMGVEEGILPHERSIAEGGLEEERRLFYVALTRGKRHVTLFEALSRSRFGRERMSKTSRFMEEIPGQLLRRHVKAARDMVEAKVAPPRPKAKKRRPRKKMP